ncbi:MAG TPA: CHAD domain-containing protein [Streptosporangiaceae bacterium]|nr:CHAD domain-containing protein [Streptosporangiaceae bacterium]
MREFVLDGEAPRDPDLLAVLAGTVSLELAWADGGRSRASRRSWLDTFDWRLYRAGLTLEQAACRGRTELLLTGRDGDLLASEVLPAGRQPRWPGLVSELPAGPLRELVEPVAGVRALCSVLSAGSKVTQLQALNDDAKTVARLDIDRMSVTFPARASAPARLTLIPVRGYTGVTDRIGEAITRAPGIRTARGSALETALAAAGLRAGDQSGKATAVQLTPWMPAAVALATILTAQLDALEANVPGTIKDIDTEFLHDLRIAVRRTRSAIKLCGRALPDGLTREFRAEFRWLGDLTTPTRDLDVYLLEYGRMTAGLVGASPADLCPFHDYLVRSRATQYRRLAAGLRSARFGRLTTTWRTALQSVRPARKRPVVAELAASRIGAVQRKALQAGQLISASSPPESLHDLRKRCKELRYLIEMFGSLHDPAQRWQAVRELKALQDCLGAFQDAEVQRTEIRAFAGRLLADRSVPAETLLAMGEIAAGLAVAQREARREFDSRFAAFASPASQDRLAVLTRTDRLARTDGLTGTTA